ncbi:damage-inducible protein DinB [Neobacillus piezotolerans]|uniref:Damage-inducible protein DinB n=1 Tax=Neobacillus piezotolerans TaxID=2259171 RepID=A0A3D8GV29_9BACI|nr:DinB family protein [Neobacillus piezotolerans]RDU38212.1 damage-inducible protein DinB [Neobacillus piezotolerans]
MYRTVNDFLAEWSRAASGTISVLESLTDEKLNQSIVEGHSSLGWLGWHLAASIPFFAGQVGLNVSFPGDVKSVPDKASEIVDAYKKASEELKKEVETNLTDEKIVEAVESLGQLMPRGATLRLFIDHQTHHRGQMTVLLRQAGLKVPGIMGPTVEDQMK